MVCDMGHVDVWWIDASIFTRICCFSELFLMKMKAVGYSAVSLCVYPIIGIMSRHNLCAGHSTSHRNSSCSGIC
jgi:hypothetical protein